MKKIVIIILGAFCGVLLFGHGPAAADRPNQVGVWTELGPQGGDITSIARNPKAPSELYAVTRSGLVFRSANNGASWTRRAAVGVDLWDVAIDPKSPSTIYALAGYALYKSVNKGGTFTKLPFVDDTYATEGSIAIDPSNTKVIYVSGICIYDTTAGKECMAVFKTVNGGKSWTVKKPDPTSYSAVGYDVVVSPKNPALVYACGVGANYKAQVFRSTNRGETWKDVTPGFMNATYGYGYAYAIAADPSNAGRAFVAYMDGVARTSNSGTTWEKQVSPAHIYPGSGIAIDKSASNTLYAGGSPLYKSTDGGKNWTQYLNGVSALVSKLIVQGKTLHIASNIGIFNSTDGGAAFAPGDKGILAVTITSFVFHRAVSGALEGGTETLYAAVSPNGLFRSTNGGGAWTKLGDFEKTHIIGSLASPRSNPRRVYLSCFG